MAASLADCTEDALLTRAEAILPTVESVASSEVRSAGCGYGVRAYLRKESFPACVLEGRTFAAGTYDALVILLGCGAGANWWGVLYPQRSGEYRSFFAELWNR